MPSHTDRGYATRQPVGPTPIVKLSPSRSLFFLPKRMRPFSSRFASSVPSNASSSFEAKLSTLYSEDRRRWQSLPCFATCLTLGRAPRPARVADPVLPGPDHPPTWDYSGKKWEMVQVLREFSANFAGSTVCAGVFRVIW